MTSARPTVCLKGSTPCTVVHGRLASFEADHVSSPFIGANLHSRHTHCRMNRAVVARRVISNTRKKVLE